MLISHIWLQDHELDKPIASLSTHSPQALATSISIGQHSEHSRRCSSARKWMKPSPRRP
jgi:hypothetical protein